MSFGMTLREAIRWIPVACGLLGTLGAATAQAQLDPGWNRTVGGILIDPHGTVRNVTVDERLQQVQALRARAGKVDAAFHVAADLRKISLRGLQAVLQQAGATPTADLPDEVRYLAGLQRVSYVLIDPSAKDIVLAGPGEGWKIDDRGNVAGTTRGLPVLRLDDLLVALRTVRAARSGGISVSIDPTPEGRRQLDQYMAQLQRQRTTMNPRVVAGIAEAVGLQEITLTGVPPDSHFASVLVAADYRLKQLAMNLDQAPIAGLPGFLDLLRAKNRLPGTATPRWWLACHYEPLARSEDRLVWQLRGQGVKAMTENEVVKDGQVQGTGTEDPVASEFATRFTEKFEALAKKDLIFSEVRNLMDLCVIAALITKEDLAGLAGCDLSLLAGAASPVKLESWAVPKHVATQCSFVKVRSNYVITASGGVAIESWQVAQRSEVQADLNETRASATERSGTSWWWN